MVLSLDKEWPTTYQAYIAHNCFCDWFIDGATCKRI